MALAAVLQTFLLDQAEAFVQRVEERWRGGVMIAMRNQQIVTNEFEVEMPRAVGGLARLQPLDGARRDGDGRESRRTAESLLGATVGDIDAGLVHVDGHGSEC